MADTRVRKALQRLRGDWSPGQFAEKAGLHRSTVYRIEDFEDQEYSPSVDTVDALVRARGTTLAQFFAALEREERTASAPDYSAVPEEPIASDASHAGEPPTHGTDPPVPADTIVFLDQLAWACLRAADAADRASVRSLLEELVVCFRRAAHPQDDGREEILATRARRAGAR